MINYLLSTHEAA